MARLPNLSLPHWRLQVPVTPPPPARDADDVPADSKRTHKLSSNLVAHSSHPHILLIQFRSSLRLFRRTYAHVVILLYHIDGPVDYVSDQIYIES